MSSVRIVFLDLSSDTDTLASIGFMVFSFDSVLLDQIVRTTLQTYLIDVKHGAGEETRTPVGSLEGYCSTIELHPLKLVAERSIELLTSRLSVVRSEPTELLRNGAGNRD